ncbi:MAG: phage major capsid protein [Marinobacterium sp.]
MEKMAAKLEERLKEIEQRRLEIRAMLETDEEVDFEAVEKELKELEAEERKLKARIEVIQKLGQLHKQEERDIRSLGIAPEAAVPKDPEKEEAEKRGQALKEGRTVTVASTTLVVPQHYATDIKPTFAEVSSLVDRVNIKVLKGGESFKQPYLVGYGTGGYTAEGADYALAETQFGYADINKAKVTAYAEDTEEVLKLPAADYDAEVRKGIREALRKLIARQILVGTGDPNTLVGIFSANATAIDPATDLSIAAIDENTLDEIIYSFGGEEAVEEQAVLILNKKDLKAFARLRTNSGEKQHDIRFNADGNSGTIDGIPFILNSACKAISDPTTSPGDYCMAYGPLSNYMLVIFSDVEILRSTDYKFRQGIIAHRGSIFCGGNVVAKNGFLRVKKASAV